MTIDIFSATGTKKGTLELPVELFGYHVNKGLIHQAIVRQQSNRRGPIAHAKNRHEVAGSTRKLYDQKHTGRARRGSIRSPLLRGGGKAFGPRSEANFVKDMPRSMRRAALRSCLSYQASKGIILGLESYPETIKTKTFMDLMKKIKLDDARRVLFVLPERHHALWMSSRNVHGMKTVLASYLNPEDIITARRIVFVGDSIQKAMDIFGKKTERMTGRDAAIDAKAAEPKKVKVPKRSPTAKKKAPVKAKKSSSASK